MCNGPKLHKILTFLSHGWIVLVISDKTFFGHALFDVRWSDLTKCHLRFMKLIVGCVCLCVFELIKRGFFEHTTRIKTWIASASGGLCQYVMAPLNTSSRASKTNALGGKGFGGNAHGWKILAISLTSSFLFAFFSEPWKIRRPLQLSLTPTLTLDSWIRSRSPLDQQRSPLSLYHSLHYHLRHPDDRRPGRKGGVSILLLASHQSKAKASCRRLSSGGFRSVADFVHGKIDGMHVWGTASSSPFEAFPRTRAVLFLHCRSFSAFWPARFSTSSCPIIIFRLTSFRLVRHDRFFLFAFSRCLFCLPRNAFTLVLCYLAIPANPISISPSASDGMRVLSLCRQSGWHILTRGRPWPSFDRISE